MKEKLKEKISGNDSTATVVFGGRSTWIIRLSVNEIGGLYQTDIKAKTSSLFSLLFGDWMEVIEPPVKEEQVEETLGSLMDEMLRKIQARETLIKR